MKKNRYITLKLYEFILKCSTDQIKNLGDPDAAHGLPVSHPWSTSIISDTYYSGCRTFFVLTKKPPQK